MEGRRVAGVFEGLGVLDLSWGTAGPMTTMLLADNGAQVIRIEPPDGDPFASQSGYRVWQRGKRSARLDLRSDDGRRAFRALASGADVVVESFAPGTPERLGVDHATVSEINPRVITCSITGYGHHPRHRDRPGLDALVAARTGLLYDQKGRRGTAVEDNAGRPRPHPQVDAPPGPVRRAGRPRAGLPPTPPPPHGPAFDAALAVAP